MSLNDQIRLARASPGELVGVDEAMIHDVVHAFYIRIRDDPLLAPVFKQVIVAGWNPHLARMCDFWSAVTLTTGRFKGSPIEAHARISEISSEHFRRWLLLFSETVTEICPPAAASLFVAKSQVIARSLMLGIKLETDTN
ncbi:group III truncated hemoglobin [Methylobacterium sp. J-070]|uniref:group III truncated hemoglobin n=1 Tax=Methylobacterium sp. J-070 TaxID=2836650 RepID=UPI001FBB22F0|nr:group III truncated hemoglobin [Methylobacterium sp. J-070]MCJ2050269.1 group III truncated hemoglobin [Methylobacterium sp. J-070]